MRGHSNDDDDDDDDALVNERQQTKYESIKYVLVARTEFRNRHAYAFHSVHLFSLFPPSLLMCAIAGLRIFHLFLLNFFGLCSHFIWTRLHFSFDRLSSGWLLLFFFFFSFVFISNILSISYFHLHERFVACLMQTMTAYIIQFTVLNMLYFFHRPLLEGLFTHSPILYGHTHSHHQFYSILFYYFVRDPCSHTQILFIPAKMIDVSNFSLYIFHIIYRLRQSDIYFTCFRI